MVRHTSKTSHRPHASHALPVGTCSINCCLHRACRLHILSIACIKETTRWTLWNFYSLCSLFFPFSSLSSFSYSPPCPNIPPLLSSFQLRHQTDKKDFFLPCFSARLPSCPGALEYLVSSITANVSPRSARSKNLTGEGGKDKKEKKRGGGGRGG